MTTRFPIALAALLTTSLALSAGLAGCTKPADTTTTTVSTTQYSSGGPAGTAGAVSTAGGANSAPSSDMQTAVAVSQALHKYPAKGDSILTSYHLTANDFAALMKRIAADSASSAQFRQLTQ